MSAPEAVREDAAYVADSAGNAESHIVACRQEVRPNSRFTHKVCRKARDWHRTALTAQGDFNGVQMRTNVNMGGR